MYSTLKSFLLVLLLAIGISSCSDDNNLIVPEKSELLEISGDSISNTQKAAMKQTQASNLKYPRPNGWENWAVKNVQGSTTVSELEVIDGGGKSLRVIFPRKTVPPVKIQNFSNLIIIGGSIRALPVSKIGGYDQRLIYLPNAKGKVHIEGMLLNGSVDGAETDGILANGQSASVRVQNTRIAGLRGQKPTNHADGFQTYLGLKEILFDQVTISSNYQGIKFKLTNDFVMTRAVFTHTNIIGLTSEESGGATITGGGYYFWFDRDGLFPIRLEDFWVKPRGNRPFGQSAWPGITNSVNPASEANNQLTWPQSALINGSVRNGVPPNGDYVPVGSVGFNYQ